MIVTPFCNYSIDVVDEFVHKNQEVVSVVAVKVFEMIRVDVVDVAPLICLQLLQDFVQLPGLHRWELLLH